MNKKKLLREAPGPSPWYFSSSSPELHTSSGPARWEDQGGSNPLYLFDKSRDLLALVGMYNYVLPVSSFRFLIWNQHKPKDYKQDFPNRGKVPKGDGPTPPVHLALYDLERLNPITPDHGLLKEFKHDQIDYYVNGEPEWSIEIPTTSLSDLHLDFPELLLSREELLIIARSSAVSYEDVPFSFNSCLIAIQLEAGVVTYYPQDWFNRGQYDYGYVWITKVARDPKTKRIVGEGIRLGEFELDHSNRELQSK